MLANLEKKLPVVAVYHPKPPGDVEADAVRRHAGAIGMPGHLAVDRDWSVLNRWRPPAGRRYTSLTFLVDRTGTIRYVHPGGAIEPREASGLEQRIDALLAE